MQWEASADASKNFTVIASPGGSTVTVPAGQRYAVVGMLTNGIAYTFKVKADSGAWSSATKAVTPAAGATIIADVPLYPQLHSVTCETAALEMALAHQGIPASQAGILTIEGVDSPYKAGVLASGILTWDDPYASFVGSPDGEESNLTGYGTYYLTIERAAHTYGAKILFSGEGATAAQVYAAVLAGHPVIAWVNPSWTRAEAIADWHCDDGRTTTPSGQPLKWFGGHEHALVVVGVTNESVVFQTSANLNPSGSLVRWEGTTKAKFEVGFSQFGGMAIILD